MYLNVCGSVAERSMQAWKQRHCDLEDAKCRSPTRTYAQFQRARTREKSSHNHGTIDRLASFSIACLAYLLEVVTVD